MRVIAFVTQKGGSGKTTLCVNLAVAAEAAGARVPGRRPRPAGHAPRPGTRTARRATPAAGPGHGRRAARRAIEAAQRQGFSHVLVDTPGRDEPGVAAAIRAADFCVVPCRPTPADMKATPATVATIRRLAKPRGLRADADAAARLPHPRGAERASPCWRRWHRSAIVMRNAFQDAHGAGLGITEYEPEGKGAEEIRELWRWLERKLEKLVP